MPTYQKLNRRYNSKPIEYVVTDSGCWECTSHAKDKCGYTQLRKTVGSKGTTVKLHRLVYEIEVEPIKEGNVVRHKCDNPSCFNPAHLEQGTQLDNARDMVDRGRRHDSSGSKNSRSKLSDRDVYEIKHLLKYSIYTVPYIANLYGVHKTQIYKIRNGERFTYITI